MADGGVHAHVGARDPVRDGVVHGLVREPFAAFAEQVKEVGRSLPGCVVAEFEAFVRCGVLACGFMRARCGGGRPRPAGGVLMQAPGRVLELWREAIGACAERAVAVGGAAVGRSAAAGGSAATAATQADAVRPARVKGGRIEWARLLWRVWKIDALKCPACDGRMTIIAALTERVGIVRVLDHLGVSTEVPRMRRTRDGP